MNNKTLIIYMVFLLCSGFSEGYAQEVILATGGELSGSGGKVSYAVGQIAQNTLTGPNGAVLPGIAQPYEIYIISGIDGSELDLEFNVYPNPITNFLNLEIGGKGNGKLHYQLYSLQGVLLESGPLKGSGTSNYIKMGDLTASTYFLKIINNKQLVKTLKIIKN